MQATLWGQFINLAGLPLLCLAISSFLGAFYWQRLSKSLKWLVLFLFFNLFIEITARFAAVAFRQNLPLLHLYTLGEFLLFSLFYRQILDDQSVFKKYFSPLITLGLGLVVLNTLLLQSIFEFNSYSKTLVQVIIILYALDYAFRINENTHPNTVQYQGLRLVNAGVLIYYCGSLFIFMASKYSNAVGEAFRIFWQTNIILNLIFHSVILIALWKVLNFRPKSSSS